jgi:hypothetical protein
MFALPTGVPGTVLPTAEIPTLPELAERVGGVPKKLNEAAFAPFIEMVTVFKRWLAKPDTLAATALVETGELPAV